jgi:diacylglycerol kinase family enzyme
LSVIHQGTGGDVARGLGIPWDEAGAIDVARTGRVRRVDVGVARFDEGDGLARGFASCANVGMSAEVVEQVTGPLKRIGKRGAFFVATMRCLARNRPRPVRITTDAGLELETGVVDVMVANNRYLGGGMLAAPRAEWDDGQFDLVVIEAARRTRLMRLFPTIYRGTHVDQTDVVRVERAREVRIDSADPTRAERVVLDGELAGRTPVTFEVIPSAIGVRVPAS